MDTVSFEQQIKSKSLAYPILIFAGPEKFLKEKAFKTLVNTYIPEGDRANNVNRCDSKDLTQTFQKIFSFSFNLSPRVFFIQNLDSIPTKQRKNFIENVFKNGVPPSVFLIFAVSDSKVVTELTSRFKQQAERIDFWAPFANRLGAWVKQETKEQGADIDLDAAEQLVNLVGPELSLLYQELSKLAISKKGKKITFADVNSAVAYTRQDTVFDFLDAFGHKNLPKALRCLESLINRGEAVNKIWYMLTRLLREYRLLLSLRADRPDIFEPIFEILQKYKAVADKSDFRSNQAKKSLLADIQAISTQMPEALYKAAGLKSAMKIKSMHLALNFSLPELIRAGRLMLNTDKQLKSSVVNPLGLIQSFTAEFLSSEKIN